MKSDKPKVLTLVGGKPILAHLLDAVIASGIDPRPVVVVGYKADDVRKVTGDRCVYAEQTEQLGTGHAVTSAKEAVGDAQTVVVLYGDHPFIKAQTLRALAARHAERGNTVTLMTATVPSFDGWYAAFERWGRILRGADGHITSIREYKDAGTPERAMREVNPALFCFDAAWLWPHLKALRNENAQKEYYLTDLVAAALASGGKISSIPVDPEEVIGINTPEERDVAERLLPR